MSDADALPGMSRVEIVIPLDPAQQPYYTVSPTCLVLDYAIYDGSRRTMTSCYKPLPADTATTLAHHTLGTNQVIIDRDNNTIGVGSSLANSVMQVPNIRSEGPAINGSITLQRLSDGSWTTSGTRNAYPTMDIWEWNNGVHTLLAHEDQTTPLALVDKLNMSQSWCSGNP